MGIEPTLPEGNRILSPARLPVPPLRRSVPWYEANAASSTRAHRHPDAGLRPAAPDRILPRSNTVGANGRRRRKRETKRQGSWRDRSVRGARVRGRGLRRRRRQRGQQQRRRRRQRAGAAHVVVLEHLLRGRRRRPTSSSRRTCRSRARVAPRRRRWSRRSSSPSSSATSRPATTRSATSRATTRPRRPAAGTRRSARRTAALYAANKSVIGVVGTFNSGCAKIIVPILNRANPGPVAMVSPANTSPGLTKTGRVRGRRAARSTTRPACATTPASSRTTTSRARRTRCSRRINGLKKVYVLNDKQTYGFGVATTFKGAAKKLGIQVVGFKGWDAKQSSYEALANAIKASGADGGLPRRDHLQQRREADQGPRSGVPDAKLIAAGRLQRPEVERRSRRRRVHQRRRPAAEGPEGRGRDVRQELRQADRRDAEPVLAVRRTGDGRDARGRSRSRTVTRRAVDEVALRPPDHERDHRQLHDQRQAATRT